MNFINIEHFNKSFKQIRPMKIYTIFKKILNFKLILFKPPKKKKFMIVRVKNLHKSCLKKMI